MPNNNGIQLLPERRKEIEIKVAGENNLIFIGLIVAGVVLVVFFIFNRQVTSMQTELADLDSQISKLDDQRNKELEGEITGIQDHFVVVSKIIDGHLVWSRVLRVLQDRTLTQFQFKSLALSFDEQKVDIEAETANYTLLARQIATYLSDDLVKDIRLDEAKLLSTGRVKVTMRILLDREDLRLGIVDNNK